jgi:hypothetical protein
MDIMFAHNFLFPVSGKRLIMRKEGNLRMGRYCQKGDLRMEKPLERH